MIKIFKNSLFVGFSLLVLLLACNETPPKINYNKTVIGLKDTNYLSFPAPVAVNTMIYLEDLTGVKCVNCPKAAEKIHLIQTNNPDKVVAVAAYPNALSGFTSPWDGFLVLNTAESDEIYTNIYESPSAMPIGGVNRRLFAGETGLNTSYNKWSGYSDIVKTEESPVVISSQVLNLDTIARKAKITVKIAFAKKYDNPLNIAVYLIESKLLSKQSMPGTEPPKDDYEHNHVLRKTVTPYNGIPLKINLTTEGNYDIGRTFEKEFEIDLASKLKIQNCAIVVLVNRFDANSKEVIQAHELALK
jgi:hypothetical protein